MGNGEGMGIENLSGDGYGNGKTHPDPPHCHSYCHHTVVDALSTSSLTTQSLPESHRRRRCRHTPRTPATAVALTMAFRSQEIYKKIARKLGEKLSPDVMESMKKLLPNSKIVMSRAKRGIYAGRHIQFGNKISEDGGNKSRRSWKPNVQEKRLFSYIHDRHIRVKVTTHALRCIDKAGGIDEYLLKTPYRKMDTELGLLWKVKTEKMYAELGGTGVAFFSPEDEAKIAKAFEEEAAAKKEARRVARRAMAKQKCIEEGRTWVENVEEENQTEEATAEDVKACEHEATNQG